LLLNFKSFAVDPEKELKESRTKLAESERYNEALKQECNRLNNEPNETNEKLQSLDIHFESLSIDSKKHLIQKDVN
jgi:FtsZ-binding cell division protein ZapB